MKPAIHHNNRGFSIVEVLVASAILSITVIAVVAMVRTGTDIQVSVKHRQAARAILNSRLETDFGFSKFNIIPSTGTIPDETVTIDNRAGGTVLTGTLTTTIGSTTVPGLSPQIPVKIVTLSVVWNESEDEADSLKITRWVTE